HKNPIDIAFELYNRTKNRNYLEKAYELDQKNKASILSLNDQLNQQVNPSNELRKKEKLLKSEITRISLSTVSSPDTTVIDAAGSKIRELEIHLGKVQDQIAITNPSVGLSIPTISHLQSELLDNRTMLLSYHLSDNKLTTFIVTTTDFKAQQQLMYPGFLTDLNNYIRQLHHSSDTIYSEVTVSRLYTFLLKEFIDKNHPRLIIIPDDELSYLPFEALKEKNTYLVEDFSVLYQYSTVLLKKELTDFKKASTVSFAPFANKDFVENSLQWDQLNYSEGELKNLPGKSFIGETATKKNFLNNIRGKDIIHLATHAMASDSLGELSYIVFAPWNEKIKADYLLYSTEIYNLSLEDNKLIILSACETGYGNLVRGEGLMSLNRAFSYAGCPDIIGSLWKADDEATAYISAKIHTYLNDGLTIDLAVQKAKKDYLSNNSINPRRKYPAYWANLVFVGNYRPLTGFSNWFWVIVILLIISFILIAFSKIRSAKV
ncbi:MAG: CHAT domain-containing protein, partial [Bacteroidota bacterium]